MNKNFIRHEFDLANLPPLTEKQKAELAALAAQPDDEIDYSDIPTLTEDFWKLTQVTSKSIARRAGGSA